MKIAISNLEPGNEFPIELKVFKNIEILIEY